MGQALKWIVFALVAVIAGLFVIGALFTPSDQTTDRVASSSETKVNTEASSSETNEAGSAGNTTASQDAGPTIQHVRELPAVPEDMQRQIDEARQLYDRLMGFKGEQLFHECGFGACSDYGQWQDAVQELSDRVSTDFMRFTEFAVLDLTMLATEYMNTGAAENDTTRSVRATIEAGLKRRPNIELSQGIVIQTDHVCKSMEPLNAFARAMNKQNFDKRILVEPECPRVYKNTVVEGPLDRAQDINSSWFFQVRADKHGKIWIGDGQVAFRKAEKIETTRGNYGPVG